MVGVRLGNELRARVERWAARHSGRTLSDALRQLVELGLRSGAAGGTGTVKKKKKYPRRNLRPQTPK